MGSSPLGFSRCFFFSGSFSRSRSFFLLFFSLRSVGEDFDGDFYSHFLVQAHDSGVVTDFLDSLDVDELAVGFEAELREFFSDLSTRDGAVEATRSDVGVSRDREAYALVLLGTLFGFLLDSGDLVSALTEVLCEDLLRSFRSDDSLTGGD